MAMADAAWIDVLPSMKGFGRALSREATASVSKVGKEAGRDFGKRFTDAAGASAGQVSKLSKAVEDARDKEAAAAGRVRVAEAKLSELRTSGRAKASQLAQAEESLAQANRGLQQAQRRSAESTEHLERSQADAGRQTKELDSSSGLASRAVGKMGGSLKDAAKQAGAFAAGAVAAGGILGTIGEAIDREAIGDKLNAQLGLTGRDAKRYGRIAGDLYAGAWGESLEQVNDTLRHVTQDIGTTSSRQLKRVSASVLDVSNAFDQDLGGVTRAVGQLMRTGLARNAKDALDIVTVGFQKGADKSEDFLDTINEYGTLFRNVGLNGKEMTGLLTQGLQAGARDADKVADAIKEFSIRAVDGSKETAAGFKALGLNAKDMSAQIAKGGPSAKKGLDTILDRLRKMPDPVKRSQAAVALFGTQAEDLGDALFALDVSKATDGLGKVGGAAKRMGATLNDNAKTNLESFKRQVTTAFVNVIGGRALPKIKEISATLAEDFGPALRSVRDLTRSVVGWFGRHETVATVLAAGLVALVAVTKAHGIAMSIQGAGGIKAWVRQGRIAQALTRTWAAVQWVLNAALSANPIALVVLAVAGLVAAIIIAWKRSETFRKIVTGAFGAVKKAAAAVWGWIKKNWPLLLGILTGPIGVAVILIVKHWDKIKATVRKVWDAIKGAFKAGIRFAVNAFLGLVQKILDGAAKAFGWVPGLGGKLKSAAAKFREFRNDVNAALGGIKNRNRTVKIKVGGDVGLLNRDTGEVKVVGRGGSYATGGAVRGAGTGTSDSIPARLSNGEHVWTAGEVASLGGQEAMYRLRGMVRAGQVPTFAAGGAVGLNVHPRFEGLSELRGGVRTINSRTDVWADAVYQAIKKAAKEGGAPLSFARAQVGKPYIWGAAGPYGYDCSGLQSALTRFILREHPYYRRMGSTGTFPWSMFSRGPGRYMIGSRRGNPGHMAGTLAGVNVESRGGEGVVVGSRARGAHDPLFGGNIWHLRGYAKGGAVGDAPFDLLHPRGRHTLADELLRELLPASRVRQYDTGGPLQPGWTMAYNGTGRTEWVSTHAQQSQAARAAERPSEVHLHAHTTGPVTDRRLMSAWDVMWRREMAGRP